MANKLDFDKLFAPLLNNENKFKDQPLQTGNAFRQPSLLTRISRAIDPKRFKLGRHMDEVLRAEKPFLTPIKYNKPFKEAKVTNTLKGAYNVLPWLTDVVRKTTIAPAVDTAEGAVRLMQKKGAVPYKNLKSPHFKFIYNLSSEAPGSPRSRQEALANLGKIGEGLLDASIAGSPAKTVIKEIGKRAFKTPAGRKALVQAGKKVLSKEGQQALKGQIRSGFKSGFKYGGGYGLASGLQEYKDRPLREQLGASAISGVASGVLGGGIGAGVPLIGAGLSPVAGKISQRGAQKARTGTVKLAEKDIKKLTSKTGGKLPLKKGAGEQAGKIKAKEEVPLDFDKFIAEYPSRQISQKARQELTQKEIETLADRAKIKAVDKEQFKGFLALFDRYIGEKTASEVAGAKLAHSLAVPAKEAQAVIKELEGGKALKSGYAKNIRNVYDELYKTAEKLGGETGQKIKYRKEYLSHFWKNSEKEIEQAFSRIGKRFTHGEPRRFASYEEGIKAGLTPRYDNPAQMVGEYAKKLRQTRANVNFLNALEDTGFIVPSSVAKRGGFVPIQAEGLPLNRTTVGGEAQVDSWYAHRNVADVLGRAFGQKPTGTLAKTLGTASAISGKAQDIILSGGVPHTPLNAFTFAQVTKDMLAGRVKSPLSAVVRSMSKGKTQQYFADHSDIIKKFAKNDIAFRTEFSIDNIVDKGTIKNIFGDSIEQAWNKAMNEKTFLRFMPMLQIEYYRDIQKAAIKSGLPQREAERVAINAVKGFYGLGSAGKSARTSQLTKDAISSFLFAPRYRESILNFWANNLKSIFGTTDKERLLANRGNLNFVVGSIATFFAMDKMNVNLNGRHIWQNPSGKTDKLLVPLSNGKTLGIPFLSSIGTLPRMAMNTALSLGRGDTEQARKELKGSLSLSLKPIADVLTNENYFGSQIYDEDDESIDKIKKGVNYLANPVTGAYTHPYIRESVKYAKGEQGGAETLSKALETPIRWYNTETIENAPFWEEYRDQEKIAELEAKARQGKIGGETASKKTADILKKQEKKVGKADAGSIIEYGKEGRIAYKTSKGIKFSDTREEAEYEVAKDDFMASNKKMMEYGGELWYNKDGKFTKKDKDAVIREETKAKAKLDMNRAKRNNDLESWIGGVEIKIRLIDEEMETLDGLADRAKIFSLLDERDRLLEEADKYLSQGGFRKGGGRRGTPKADFAKALRSSIKIPIKQAQKPALASVSVPRATQVSVPRSKKITKETLIKR